MSPSHPSPGPCVAIIGAGIGGLTLGLELDRRGLRNWEIYDREDGIGGTWWVNRYPGCRCDIPAIIYSHSRFQNPNWSQSHPPRTEILDYWSKIAREQDLQGRITLRHEFVSATYDLERQLYVITLRDLSAGGAEKKVEANVLVGATGIFSTPQYIDLPGRDEFEGTVIHAARWPRDLENNQFSGKKVIVVGNGCSGVQAVTELSRVPNIDLVSLARARQWFMRSLPGASRNSIPYSKRRNELWSQLPMLLHVYRFILATLLDFTHVIYSVKHGRKLRERTEVEMVKWMKAELPEYMHKDMIPQHAFGAKRLIFEDGYFAALNKPNVRHVTGRIQSLKTKTIVLDDGSELEADCVILATGYNSEAAAGTIDGTTDSTANYSSRADLTQYYGVALPGIPNYYDLLGNNMCLNHSECRFQRADLPSQPEGIPDRASRVLHLTPTVSITTVLEVQANYLGQIIQAMRDYNIPEVEVRRAAAQKYDKWVVNELDKTIWTQVSNYWRKEGTGRIFTHYPSTVRYLVWSHRTPKWADYMGLEPVARRQRFKRVLFVIALLLGSWFGFRRTNARARARTAIHELLSVAAAKGLGIVAAARGLIGVGPA